ncbi:MAG TPA: CocE/NonD family hydrolase [Acidobacteriota bacterium]|nr:CocE/NonD family hydrolase [Acidobacteriota bacterium]
MNCFRSVAPRLLGVWLLVLWSASLSVLAQETFDVKAHYTKYEYQIPMRDGVKLFTSVYVPKDTSQKYPILMNRTPYTVSPYGADYKENIGPSVAMAKEGYIFVYQDVRGKWMSEGDFMDVRPVNPNKKGPQDIDESSDTYDTIDWLVKNIPNNNGKVGMWGISYPGFYAALGLVESHPALVAVSPQAPIADWFIGDDFHHNGAFYLIDFFRFYYAFGQPRPKPTIERSPNFEYGTPDGYKFFLELGPLTNINAKYYKNKVAYWNEASQHGTYDEYWKARNVLPHLKNVKPAVMTVGGWFDAEDLYGPLHIYDAVEKNNPGRFNMLVMGPWYHGGWARTDGENIGSISFAQKSALHYREQLELPFFNFHLKGKGAINLPEAAIFNTGANQWRAFETWPPKNLQEKSLYFHPNGRLSFEPPTSNDKNTFDEYVSDPAKPVPFTNEITNDRSREYMVEDQRFAARRPDVLVYQTDVLPEDVTLAGPMQAELFVSTTGTDSDWIVKVIDVFPDDEPDNGAVKMGGYQMLVRGEVMRGKFRNSYEKPEAMKPGQVTRVPVPLQDLCHTFRKGHRLMIQVQSSWFPLVDRNPQKFVDIYNAKESDFQKATQRVYRAKQTASRIKVGVL